MKCEQLPWRQQAWLEQGKETAVQRCLQRGIGRNNGEYCLLKTPSIIHPPHWGKSPFSALFKHTSGSLRCLFPHACRTLQISWRIKLKNGHPDARTAWLCGAWLRGAWLRDHVHGSGEFCFKFYWCVKRLFECSLKWHGPNSLFR